MKKEKPISMLTFYKKRVAFYIKLTQTMINTISVLETRNAELEEEIKDLKDPKRLSA
jgi:cell division protein FtsB